MGTQYYGRVDRVPYAEAMKAFRAKLAESVPDSEGPKTTVAALAIAFDEWLAANRGKRTREGHAARLAGFLERFGNVRATRIGPKHLDEFVATLRAAGHHQDYVSMHQTTVFAMFNRGVKLGVLPPGFRPFANVELIRRLPRAVGELEIPTPDEVRRILDRAAGYRDANMGDLISLFYHTGARTKELLVLKAGQFFRSNRQIIQMEHKRAHTMRDSAPRTIWLNARAMEIVERRTAGLGPDDFVFQRKPDGSPYRTMDLANRFAKMRKTTGVRTSVSVYSFRHLWISESLMAGTDALLVARMAGTSVTMIYRVYGHFRSASCIEALDRLDNARSTKG